MGSNTSLSETNSRSVFCQHLFLNRTIEIICSFSAGRCPAYSGPQRWVKTRPRSASRSTAHGNHVRLPLGHKGRSTIKISGTNFISQMLAMSSDSRRQNTEGSTHLSQSSKSMISSFLYSPPDSAAKARCFLYASFSKLLPDTKQQNQLISVITSRRACLHEHYACPLLDKPRTKTVFAKRDFHHCDVCLELTSCICYHE